MNLNATILGQSISFILFVWFCVKYIWPPIILVIENRQKKIKDSLILSKNARKEFHITQKKMHEIIQEANFKAACILKRANEKKILILEQAKKKALQESKQITINAKSELQIEIERARKDLHSEIVNLSISIAEKIIKKNIKKNENQTLIDQLVMFLPQVKF
ncbi:F0F1 ATP synthase subunit B [Buchnera aphidicola (Muscaphis stroyani)]|uniref:ATP synthase subunit b n=1 Tax=Buchnera aphidicola (Muscaphis stroyani) TaxID=1241869 RepID=A0A4D6Y472_9GAMM|nr:F0F1 ATP synthase subunit B [Buchnera aphidicola]QCI24127.1 F0F1 ATP synthase subunit B [Buchnera aphidicola (Muscaphis stroyani)]